MKRIALGVLFVLSMTCLSCSEIRHYAEILREGRISAPYLDTLDRWTREKTVYVEFETMARVVATERSRAFNEAYRQERDRIHPSSTAEKGAGEALETGDFDGLEYFFYAYVPDKKWNDFARSNSIWKVSLILGEEKTLFPADLREIENITPVIQGFSLTSPRMENSIPSGSTPLSRKRADRRGSWCSRASWDSCSFAGPASDFPASRCLRSRRIFSSLNPQRPVSVSPRWMIVSFRQLSSLPG